MARNGSGDVLPRHNEGRDCSMNRPPSNHARSIRTPRRCIPTGITRGTKNSVNPVPFAPNTGFQTRSFLRDAENLGCGSFCFRKHKCAKPSQWRDWVFDPPWQLTLFGHASGQPVRSGSGAGPDQKTDQKGTKKPPCEQGG